MRFGMFWGHGWPWLDGWPARKCCRHAEPLPCEHPKTWWWATGPCNAQDVIRGCGSWRVLSPDEGCQHATISHYHNRTRGKFRPWRRCSCNLKQPEVQGQSFTFSALTPVHLYHVASTLHVLYILSHIVTCHGERGQLRSINKLNSVMLILAHWPPSGSQRRRHWRHWARRARHRSRRTSPQPRPGAPSARRPWAAAAPQKTEKAEEKADKKRKW